MADQPRPPNSTSPQREVSPLPTQGPGAYLSYAYDELTTNWIPALVDALRRAGVRALFDRDGIDVSGGSFEATIAALAPNLRAIIAVANATYLARAGQPSSGVASDLKVFEDLLLLDPNAETKLFVLLDAEVKRDDLPASLLTAPSLGTQVGRDPAEPAALLSRLLQTSPAPISELIPFAAAESRLHGLRDSETLRHVGSWTDRSSRLITSASLLAGLLQRESDQPSERRLPGVERTPFVQRLLGLLSSWSSIGPERLGVTNSPLNTPPRITPPAFSALRWASLLARSVGAPQTQPLHLLAALLVQHAPWRAEVDRFLIPLELSRDELAKVVVELAASGDPALGFTAQLMTRLRAALRIGPPTAAPTPAPPKAAPKAPRKAPSKVAAVAPLEEAFEQTLEQPLEEAAAPAAEEAEPAPAENLADFAQTDRGLARLDPDSPSGVDRLNITNDVTALAKVLASWRLAPPLAVGLFGEWGSGKTFFMHLLREQVGALSKSARDRATTLQRDEAYCKHIAQVEFNAWHYSEGDLWAGMVHHIFSNLQIDKSEGESEFARRQKQVLQTVAAADAASAEAKKKVEQQVSDRTDAAKRLDDAAREALAAKRDLVLRPGDLLQALTENPTLRELAKSHLERAGIDAKALGTAKEVSEALENARTQGLTLANQVRQLVQDFRQRPARALAAILGVLVLPPLLIGLLRNWNPAAEAWLAGMIKSAVAFGPSVVAALVGFSNSAARLSAALDRPRQLIEQARERELSELRAVLAQKEAAVDQARAEAAAADAAVLKARAELDSLSPERILSDFLANRAGADDYRKKLGLLATIRADFDRLSRLMAEQKKAEDDPKNLQPAKPDDKTLRLNRIILYIDDLDRCPPDRVVQVLQAIHLLLAFDLFVVVVGVDARWVQRSLRHQYKLMLRSDGRTPDAPARDDAPEDHDTIATPRDYLEKIFQIPFWLPSLSGADYAELIQALAQPKPPAEPAAPDRPAPIDLNAPNPAANANIAPNVTPKPASNVAADPATLTPNAPAPASPNIAAQVPGLNGPAPTLAGASTPPAIQPPASTPPAPPAPPKEVPERVDVLHLDDREVTVMQELADLYGRSPRAVKRFVNCYRLFKSMLLEHGRQPYLPPTPAGFQPYELALLLLAVVVGSPSAARRLIDEVSRPANNAKPLRSLFKPPPANAPEAAATEWRRLEPFLTRIPATLATQQARDLVFRAWRFSFRSADAQPPAHAASVTEPKPLPAQAPRGPA